MTEPNTYSYATLFNFGLQPGDGIDVISKKRNVI